MIAFKRNIAWLFLPLLTAFGLLVPAASVAATSGAFTYGAPANGFKLGVTTAGLAPLADFETAIGRQPDIFLWYQHINQSLDMDIADYVASHGMTLQLSWEPIPNPKPDPFDPTVYQLRNFTRGDFDADIRRWADELRDYGHPVLFRPFCEMNGDWVYWSDYTNGNSPGDFIAAWRHMHDIFRQEGASNVLFVWSPNRDGSAADAMNTFDHNYPGDDYLDYIGFSGYNWGDLYTDPPCGWTSYWQDPVQVFGDSYDVMAARSTKPIMISEMAAPESGGDKAAWITQLFDILPTRFPRIVSITWFNMLNREACQVTDTDWRVQSSPAAQAAFAAGISNMDKAGVTRCVRPALTASARRVYWPSYASYLDRSLAVDVQIANPGVVNAYGLQINGSQTSNGVLAVAGFPQSAGDIPAGTSASTPVTIFYSVPIDVDRFTAHLDGTVADSCGNQYSLSGL